MLAAPSNALATSLSAIAAEVRSYAERADGVAYGRILDLLATLISDGSALSPAEVPRAQALLFDTAHVECAWALMAGDLLWRSGVRTPTDFLNISNCARFAGFSCRFTRIGTAEHLELAQQLKVAQPSPAVYILLGNALRHLHQYTSAEDAYLEGIHRFPDFPFLKFRLVDLYLATYKLAHAHQLLTQLKPLYPYAREMMFITPAEVDPPIGSSALAPPHCGESSWVWFVAADPVYTERYAHRLLQSARSRTAGKVHFHVHLIRDLTSGLSADAYATLHALAGSATFTERKFDMSGRDAEWRKALYASERFLLLAEILKQYRKPVLVTDIDVECLRDPAELLTTLGEADFGYTNFRSTTEAWERYAATALIVRPTAAAIAFFERMAAMLLSALSNHAQPWFVDQIVLFRMIEENPGSARGIFLDEILTDCEPPSLRGFFRLLHASWN